MFQNVFDLSTAMAISHLEREKLACAEYRHIIYTELSFQQAVAQV